MSLGIVVPYCSNEEDLIDQVLDSLTQVSDNIVVVCMTHFFNGEEDTKGLEKVQSLVKKGIKAKVMPWKEIPGAPQNFWIKEMRLYGFQALSNCDWVLFVDSDEVLRQPKNFLTWFDSIKENVDTSYKLCCYWYFLSKRRRSKVIEDSIVLVHRQCLSFGSFRLTTSERENLSASARHQFRNVRDLENQVMFDHYSWVRPKDVLLRKVSTWGHRNDRDWLQLVHTAFEQDILTTPDFVHANEYDILDEER
jgi:hypothetical protein